MYEHLYHRNPQGSRRHRDRRRTWLSFLRGHRDFNHLEGPLFSSAKPAEAAAQQHIGGVKKAAKKTRKDDPVPQRSI
jgi:hypothetical protein